MERRFTSGIHKNEVTGEDFVGCDYERGECNDSCLGGTCKWVQKALRRLAELEDKIEQGKMIEFPRIVKTKKLDAEYYVEFISDLFGGVIDCYECDTREEAEKRLKELQEGGGK